MNENTPSAPATLYVRPFVSILAKVTDFRQQLQYPLPTLLSVILLGLVCGHNTIRRIAAWAQQMPLSLRRHLGLPHARVPSRSTLQHTLAHLNVDDLLCAWQTWVEEARAIWPHAQAHLQLATR
ncbi:MAG: transposase family protein [Thermoflexales bacterium]|nr:transposase family protein [Thermoflexales bacterium]